MDNRRLSARAEMGAAAPTTRPSAVASFLDRTLDISKANWEVLLYIGLMTIAIFTRIWDLGPRALHHDESIHAYYSNLYAKGGGYDYNPVYHGPFLYHIVALGFTLFGTNDALARLMPAVFGIMLVAFCWTLRPFIGRVGALIAVLLVTLSPSVSYYSRSLRHDVFSLTMLTLLFVCILYFLRTHQAKWVFIGGAALAISFSSHELTYIVALIFALFLAIAAFLYPRVSARMSEWGRHARGDEGINPVTSALRSLGKQPWTILGGVLAFFAIYVVLFTNLLTRPTQILAGFTESLTYWLGQHEVQRGNQPRFYYLLMMPIYEPLAFFAGIGTTIYMVWKWITGSPDRASDIDDTDVNAPAEVDEYGVELPSILGLRGLTLAFLAFWSFGALMAFSLAGERMPWLLMHSALPFTLLASAGLGRLLTAFDWKAVLRGGAAFLGVAVLLFLFSAFAFMRYLSGPKTGDAISLLQGALLFLFTIGLLALSGWLAYRITPGKAVAAVGVTFAVVLALYGLRSMMLVNYRHGDVPVEMLVYTQSAPDVPIVADRIKRLSRDETAFDQRNAQDVTGGRSLQIGIDQLVEWPFDWYFRDMRSITYFPTNDPNSYYWDQPVNGPLPPVLLVDDQTVNKANFQNAVKDKYVSQKYVLRWWFPEELYKTGNEGDLGKALNWVTGASAASGQSFLKYLLYRDPGLPLGSTNFNLYVRNDLAVKMGMAGAVGLEQPEPDTAPARGMYELGGAGAAKGQFNLPRGIAQDSNGNFYVVDTQNFRVQKFDSQGVFQAQFGRKGTGDGQFTPYDETVQGSGPSGIAVDKAGNIYVADTWNHRIQKFDGTGKFIGKWGSFINLSDPNAAADPAKDSKFYGPRGVTVGPDGNIYVADTGNKRIAVFDANGKFLRQISSGMSPQRKSPEYPFSRPGEMNEPVGVAVDNAGNVYVADSVNKRIQKFDAQGNPAAQWAIPNAGWDPGPYLEPFLAVDAAGNIYATAPTGKTVLKFSPTGQLLAQKNRNESGTATLQLPTGITVSPDGVVNVVDTNQHGVLKLGKIE